MPARARRPGPALALRLCACLAAGGCGLAPGDGPAIVFAASSLTEAFTALEREFEAGRPGTDVALHFAGSSTLALQLEQGAPADAFAAADERQMERARAAGRLAESPVVFARGRLAILVPRGNPEGIAGPADLAREGLRVALAGPEVPAGRYAREALARAGARVTSVSDEPNVRALVGKIALGELDAGVAYETDARAGGGAVEAVPLADGLALAPAYPIAPTTGGGAPDVGAAFVRFVLSEEGRAVLAAHGFRAP